MMLFQEIELDDRITIDSHSCDTTDTTNAEASLSYDSDKVKVNYKNKKKNIIISTGFQKIQSIKIIILPHK